MERLNNGDYEYPGPEIPSGQPGIRPMVDPEAAGEVDPTRYTCMIIFSLNIEIRICYTIKLTVDFEKKLSLQFWNFVLLIKL